MLNPINLYQALEQGLCDSLTSITLVKSDGTIIACVGDKFVTDTLKCEVLSTIVSCIWSMYDNHIVETQPLNSLAIECSENYFYATRICRTYVLIGSGNINSNTGMIHVKVEDLKDSLNHHLERLEVE